jgi:peroxiredoxin
MKKRVFLAALAVLALTPALLMAYPSVGSPAPNFTLPDTALVNHSLTDYRGKVVQLLFWQST